MLRKFISILFVLFVTCGLMMHDADARRFGGGRSFGVQRSASSFTRPAAPASSGFGSNFNQSSMGMNKPASLASTATGSRWFGPLLAGLGGGLLGGMLGGMLSHALGGGLMTWILIGGAIFLALSFLRNRMQPMTQPGFDSRGFQPNNNFSQETASPFTSQQNFADSAAAVATPPSGFDAETFLREAKVQFIRLQAAYDQKNLDDLRQFTSPEVFAEIQLQFHERGEEENKTNVVQLNAEVLDVTTEMQTTVATVRFSGLIQENQNESAALFNEMWHFKKEVANQHWMVSGIQQA